MTALSENTSIATLEKEVVHNDDATVRGQTAGAQSTSPLFNEDAKPQPAAASPDNEASEYITGVRLYLVLLGVTAVMFLVMLDMTIVVTAIPSISNDFDSIKDIGWYGTAYLLCSAALQPLSGKLYQYYTSKKLFLGGVFIFELGSLICALAKSSNVFIVGRAISGIGTSGLTVGMLTIVASSAPLNKRPLYLGFMMGMGSIGLVLGPVIGGILSQHASWRWCFWINLPVGGITAALLTFIQIPNAKLAVTDKPTTFETFNRLDLPGFALFAPACVMLLLAIEWGGVTYSWRSATVIGPLCGAVVLLGIFFLWEGHRGDTAMIPFYLLKNRVVVCACTTVILSQGSMMVVTYYVPIWFQVVKNASPSMGGVYYLPSVGSQVVGSILTGALTSRLGYYTPFAIAGTALTSISCGLLSTLTPTSNAGMWAGYQIMSGFSRGLTMQQPLTAVQAVIPKHRLAVANSFLMFCQILGGALFVSFAQTIFTNALKPALKRYAPDVDPETVYAVGASAFRTVIEKEQVRGVVLAYNDALNKVFYLGAGATVVAFGSSFGLGWTNLKATKATGDVENVKLEDVKPQIGAEKLHTMGVEGEKK
ncbi:putative MFS multidrug transporter [Rhexocercosporidium sp. MPI-PUGE-AT-0058]|nr:putative MFS multidrug transporter [Rhexocercosporidium sp. MPI-PUGE-AT-0058]